MTSTPQDWATHRLGMADDFRELLAHLPGSRTENEGRPNYDITLLINRCLSALPAVLPWSASAVPGIEVITQGLHN